MADKSLPTIYSENPITPDGSELLYLVDDPSGTPANAASTVDDILAVQHDHTVSDITDFPTIPTDFDDLTDGTTNKAFTSTLKDKLDGIEASADVTDATNVAAAGAFMKASDDLDDVSEGSTNKHFTATLKNKLDGIAEGAEVNVQADWDASTGDAAILNKPTLGTAAAADSDDFATASHTHAQSDITNLATDLAAKAADNAVVKLTGNQSVAGVKTFTDSPVVPTPTTDMQVATKKYVDDNSGGGGGAWGSITGTLSDQTDLQNALDAKQDELTGLTASVSELNILDGATLSTTELNYVDGVTSAIQTQLDAKLEDVDIADINATGTADSSTYLRGDGTWSTPAGGGGGGASNFTDLGDVPSSYSGQGEKFVAVKADASGLEFVDAPSGGGGGGAILAGHVTTFESWSDFTITTSGGASTPTTQSILVSDTDDVVEVRRRNYIGLENLPTPIYLSCLWGSINWSAGHAAKYTYQWFSTNNNITQFYRDQVSFNVTGTVNVWGDTTFSTGDGTTEQTNTAAISYDGNGGKSARMGVVCDGTSVEFYVNGVLKATNSTNIPRLGSASALVRTHPNIRVEGTANTSAATQMTVQNSQIQWELGA